MKNYFNLTNREREELVDDKTRDDRVTVSLMNGKKVDCVDVQPRVFNTYLVVEKLFNECCYLDTYNRSKVMNLTLAELLDLYGTSEELYNSFATPEDRRDN